MRIVGTAGHVDHGKSALVLSLTGRDPDRWAEERERGMTLDLGFAPLRFSDGLEAGVIDVPGHERFIHNMLAGAAGVDVLLLVIDTLEGPRAQTREHLEILSFLNVSRTIVVMTKIDLAGDERREAAAREVEQFCAGTIAAGAPLVWVSNVTSEGIDELKAAIHDALAGLPAARDSAPAFLPVDRAFALPGHGTIVTGTLLQGTIRRGETLALQPAGVPARVRTIETFGRKTEMASAGARVALNMPGIDVSTVRRGDVIAADGAFEPVSALAVVFQPLPAVATELRRRTPVRVHIGSAEIEGRLLLEMPPSDGFAQGVEARIELRKPTVVYPGERAIVRLLSPKKLLGGAVVRRLAAGVGVAAHREPEAGDDPVATACLAVTEEASRTLRPMPARAIAASANIRVEEAAPALAALSREGRVAALARPEEFLSRGAFERAWETTAGALRHRHSQAPWRLGCSATEIASAIGIDDALALRLLAAWHEDGRVAQRNRFWHLPDFTPSLRKEQRAFFEAALSAEGPAPLVPASFDAIMERATAAKIVGIREAFESLVAAGALTRIGDDVYRRSQFLRIREIVTTQLAAGPARTSTLREALGLTRKHALPLLEHLDAAGVTMRDGDVRRLRFREETAKTPVNPL